MGFLFSKRFVENFLFGVGKGKSQPGVVLHFFVNALFIFIVLRILYFMYTYVYMYIEYEKGGDIELFPLS